MFRILTLLLFIATYSSTIMADNLEQSRIDLEAKKKVSISKSLALSDNESHAFWNVYSGYERDSGALTQQNFDLIRRFSESYKKNTVTEQGAAKLLEEYFQIEESKLKLKQDYVAKFSAVLPAKKVVRFYQIDNKIDSLIRCDIAKKLPLIEPDMEF